MKKGGTEKMNETKNVKESKYKSSSTKEYEKYKYIKSESIVKGLNDYELEEREYYLLYSFFVTYSLCGSQSFKKRNFEAYGWKTSNIQMSHGKEDTDLGKMFKRCIQFEIDVASEKKSVKDLFKKYGLGNGVLQDYAVERVAIVDNTMNSKYLKLFYRLRNCLAHGSFLLKYSSNNEKMIVLQDNDKNNVTARMVLKLKTLINLIEEIDKKKLIIGNEKIIIDKDVA